MSSSRILVSFGNAPSSIFMRAGTQQCPFVKFRARRFAIKIGNLLQKIASGCRFYVRFSADGAVISVKYYRRKRTQGGAHSQPRRFDDDPRWATGTDYEIINFTFGFLVGVAGFEPAPPPRPE
jgi:hypothetical protein